MASFYDKPLFTATQLLSPDEFEDNWMIREKAVGRLKYQKLFLGVLTVLSLFFLSFALPDLANSRWMRSIAALTYVLFCICMAAYESMILPQRVKMEAVRMYRTNRLLQSETQLTVTRDGYTLKNRYETRTGYWSETAFCAETERSFVFCGGRERDPLIILKDVIPAEEREHFSEKMQEIFSGRYRRLKL